jgi:hypothetical protein
MLAQKELIDTFERTNKDWCARAKLEATVVSELAANMAAAKTGKPDAQLVTGEKRLHCGAGYKRFDPAPTTRGGPEPRPALLGAHDYHS